MAAHLDRIRAGRLMVMAGLDALVILSPEGFRHASGADPGVATMWRRAGAVAVLVPADPALPEAAVVSDLFAPAFRRSSHIGDVRINPIWVETADLSAQPEDLPPEALIARALAAEGRPEGFARPATFDAARGFGLIRAALADRGLAGGVIGVEMSAISAADLGALQAAMAGLRITDAGMLPMRLRMVKTEAEIGHLRAAVTLAEIGIRAVRDAVRPGVRRRDLSAVWAAAVAENRGARALTGAWDYISVGPDPWAEGGPARPGDLIKVDAGCVVAGYTSDSARTFVLGAPSPLQARLHAALMAGFAAGAGLLAPGTPLGEVHRATEAAIRGAGFPGYARGHFGHALGLGPGSEDWPFISADATECLEPGMVMAFECPWYVTGLGGLIVENQVLITEGGAEMMNRLPLALVALDGAGASDGA